MLPLLLLLLQSGQQHAHQDKRLIHHRLLQPLLIQHDARHVLFLLLFQLEEWPMLILLDRQIELDD
jgi:hypothetical protein